MGSLSFPEQAAPALPRLPIVWTIAGTDPGGGAGIQADLKTMNALGVHGCSVITALIAQNTVRVRSIEWPSPSMLEAQFAVLREDLPPSAVKLGMLGNETTVRAVARHLATLDTYVVCDPVLVSSSGTPLLESGAVPVFRDKLLPLVDLLTPNLPEAERLLGHPIDGPGAVEAAAEEFLAAGVSAILIKGGHGEGDTCQDFWTDGRSKAWLTLPRLSTTSTHGTGCILSSAIASCRARGYTELDALVVARAYVNQGLRTASGLGRGRGPLNLGGWPASPEDLPWITNSAEEGRRDRRFPDCGDQPLGLYPIVDRAAWLTKLMPLGLTTVQLRIKDLTGVALEEEIRTGIEYARSFGCRLFINDQWQLAIKYKAYGVHVGQDDLETVDPDALEQARLRLGISTHSYAEIARAWAFRPSYMAVGTLFETTSKVMDYPALGLEEFSRMRKLIGVPTVAIGGIHLERASEVLAAGADGLAVISEIKEADDLEGRVRDWKRLLDR